MQARLTTKPVEQVISSIQALDLESVKLRVMDAELGEGWTREYADSIEVAYKNYLTMLVKYPDDAGDILISKDVDEFWHMHILHTRQYAEDCQNVFGNFLHHNPRMPERTAAEAEKRAALAEKTRRLYRQEFKNPQATNALSAGGDKIGNNTAYCDAAVQTRSAVYCDASVRDAAYCDASVRADNAAYCDAAVPSHNAAYCDASARDAAYCDASIRANNLAYCDAAVRSHNAAYCDASVRDAAYCDASIRADNAVYCDAIAHKNVVPSRSIA